MPLMNQSDTDEHSIGYYKMNKENKESERDG